MTGSWGLYFLSSLLNFSQRKQLLSICDIAGREPRNDFPLLLPCIFPFLLLAQYSWKLEDKENQFICLMEVQLCRMHSKAERMENTFGEQ